jgi:MFS family permease
MSISPAKQEWADNWQLPLLAAIGIAGSATFAYSSGVFMKVMTGEFGWSRTQFSSAFAVQMVLGLIVGPLIGRYVDRVGARKVGLIGIFLFAAGLSSMGLANGKILQWWMLGGVQAICTAFIASPVWLSAVVPRFQASRGLALAVSLAGIGVATALWPILAALGIQSLGWRATFPVLGLGWAVLILPFAWFCLPGQPASPLCATTAAATIRRDDYLRALRSRTFLCVTFAGAIFASVTYGLILHLVPLLTERGLTLAEAAGLTSIMGLFVIGGRLTTGFLLDRLPTRPLAVAIFLLPVGVCLLLWAAKGSWFAAVIAVSLLGLATGSETDVVVFMIAQRFGREIFASVFAVSVAAFAVFAATGPLLAGALYDAYKSYDIYLMIAVPLTLLAGTLVALVRSALAPTVKISH